MELVIEKKQLKKYKLETRKHEFKIYSDEELIYTAKRSRMRPIIEGMTKIYLYDKYENKICFIKQEGWLQRILINIPIIGSFLFAMCPYIFYKDEVRQGYLKWQGGKVNTANAVGEINNDKYKIHDDGRNIFIDCNGKQVAHIIRDKFMPYEDGKYKLFLDEDFDKEIAIMCTIFIDIDFSETRSIFYNF
ncbi:hypothetical protein [Romboutsia lituseburensis]|uniref:Uncharacterized protein n=1 Tax=Romboutsia lituseburensis DSM 797 TaxID=1121325 RepID=A0A1G9PLT0_9FIRM|nr:hypothetical protein [Romboutsia lituseburensis]CEH33425.1 Hypothetical protein RLITU_0824 [Romboutsia lituseburensis]SDL99177.1 hypothetical protein SAMN04515677_104402 [Romboutsia lituseburensis DSM 797]